MIMNAMNILMREIVEASRAYYAQMAATGTLERNNYPAPPGALSPVGLPQNPSRAGGAAARTSVHSREPHGIRELDSPLSE